MATRKTATPAYEPGATYRVKFKRVARLFGAVDLAPLDEHEMTGETLTQVVADNGGPDIVEFAEPV